MPGRTPTEAFIGFINPLQQALGFIAAGRLVVGGDSRGIHEGQPEKVSFNGGDPVRLRFDSRPSTSLMAQTRMTAAWLDIGMRCRQVLVVRFLHFIGRRTWSEISGDFRTCILGLLVSGEGGVAPDRFHKLHIPTGHVSVPAFVGFAIQEFGVSGRTSIGTEAALHELDRLEQLG